MAKFNFSEEQVGKWKDNERLIKGSNDTMIILIHGWSSMPKRLLPLAEHLNKKGYWILLPKLKGHGERPESLEDAKADDWIEDICQSIRKAKEITEIKNVFVGGTSMGGNLSMLASLREKIDGIVLLGTPVYLKNHFWIWLGTKCIPFFKKYVKKEYHPKGVKRDEVMDLTYQYFPIKSVGESLSILRRTIFSLKKITTPILILQTNSDYMVAKFSPWIIYNKVKSDIKKLQWMQTKYFSHVPIKEEFEDYFFAIDRFVKQIKDSKK